jgi:TonB family protein
MSQRNVKSVPGWTEGVSQWLIHHAAARAPQSLSQRLEEEWLADLIARPSAMSRLRFAIGCCWATQVIALEYQPLSVPVTSAGVAGKHMGAFTRPGLGNFSSRSSTMFLVVSLHALVFYGLLTTIVHRSPMPPKDPLVNQALIDPLPADPLVLPDPTLNTSRVVALPPRFPPTQPLDWNDDDAKTGPVVQTPWQPLQPSHPHQVTQVQGGPGVGFPNTDDFYPAAARRLEEQGVATVRVCVDGKGRLTAEPTTVQGTGSARLDEGALKLARAGSGHYRATTEDGQPVSSCYPLRIRFQLKN